MSFSVMFAKTLKSSYPDDRNASTYCGRPMPTRRVTSSSSGALTSERRLVKARLAVSDPSIVVDADSATPTSPSVPSSGRGCFSLLENRQPILAQAQLRECRPPPKARPWNKSLDPVVFQGALDHTHTLSLSPSLARARPCLPLWPPSREAALRPLRLSFSSSVSLPSPARVFVFVSCLV